jgi:hypothetical protein
MPVLLPTENDMLSPSNFDEPSPADIENGLAMGMSQYDATTPSSATRLTGLPPTSPFSRQRRSSPTTTSPISDEVPVQGAPLADVTDLLVDSGAAEATAADDAVTPDLLAEDDPPVDEVLTSDAMSTHSAGGSVDASDGDEVANDETEEDAMGVTEDGTLVKGVRAFCRPW